MTRSRQRQGLPGSILIALTVIFGLQMIRVLLPTMVYYLRDSRGVNALNLAPLALGIFAVSFLAAPLRRLLGQRWALIISAGGVALLRAAEQFVVDPAIDLILVSVGVALFAIFPAIVLEVIRSDGARGTYEFGLALLLGVAADTAIHSAAGTLDLTWQDGFGAILLVLILVVIALALLWRWAMAIDPGLKTASGWPMILVVAAIGPWLFLQIVVFQNVARLAAIAGWSVPTAGLFIGAGNVIGLIAAAHAPRSKRVPGLSILVAVALFAILFFVETGGLLGALLSVAGQVLSASLLLTILLAPGLLAQKPGRMGASAANGIGQMLFVILTFVFYISLEIDFGFRAPAVLPVAGLIVAVAALVASRVLEDKKRVANNLVPAGVTAALLLLPIILWIGWTQPEAVTPAADNKAVRIVDYNLHNGFNTDGRLDLEALAQNIEAQNPDIITLQEVSRGWAINGSADMIEWLSQRLGLPYAFDPTETHQWGNAILSRYPILSLGTGELPPESLRLRRGYIVAEIDTGEKDLWVINTHLHHFEEDSDIRVTEVPVLIYAWNKAARTVITGDFNATPDAPEMAQLADAGFYDVGAFIGPDPGYTYYSADPYQRIDYIWITQDLIPALYEVPQTTASDHLPIAVTITIP